MQAVAAKKEQNPQWCEKEFSRLEKESIADLFLKPRRQESFSQFSTLGFPTASDEEWRYTNVKPLAETPFIFHTQDFSAQIDAAKTKSLFLENLQGPKAVFVNGFFSKTLSSLNTVPEGLTIASLAEILADPNQQGLRQILQERLSKLALSKDHAFVSLNTSFLKDATVIQVKKGARILMPVEILHVAYSPDERPFVYHPRLLMVAEEGSEALIIEHFVSLENQTYFCNAVGEVFLGRNARLDHVHLQEQSAQSFHMNYLRASQERDSRFLSYLFSFGGKWVRNESATVMNDTGCDCHLLGLSIASDHQHMDHRTTMDHAKPHCTSDELYKIILKGKARGVFNGKIIVRPDAQKTQAFQSNRNLLLSEEASIDTKPQLEIFADDVKCTHGATVGQLDENALFYLRSRGIPQGQAHDILVEAFAKEIILRVPEKTLQEDLTQRFAHKFSRDE